jgi:Tfp pilus assembly protein PilN
VIDFRLNLIRDQVPSRSKRRLQYRVLMAYLALTGLLLVGAVSLASTRWMERAGVRGKIDQIERFYQSGHEGQGDLKSGVARLQEKFQAQVDGLQATENLLATDPRPARLIRSLLVALPSSVSLRNFRLLREEGSLQFELLSVGGYRCLARGINHPVAEGSGGPSGLERIDVPGQPDRKCGGSKRYRMAFQRSLERRNLTWTSVVS